MLRHLSWCARNFFRKRFFIFVTVVVSIVCLTVYHIKNMSDIVLDDELMTDFDNQLDKMQQQQNRRDMDDPFVKAYTSSNDNKEISTEYNSLNIKAKHFVEDVKPCYNVHVFYYPWYGNPQFDGKYIHWNHKILPHWNPEIAERYPGGQHIPPEDIASSFYPALGPYSSSDKNVIYNHMKQIRFAGIGVLSVSYYPPSLSDENGEDWQKLFPLLLDAASKFHLKIAFHSEPYPNRSETSVADDLKHIVNTYGSHSAFYHHNHHGKSLPLVYIYDSYHITTERWQALLTEGEPQSIRGTQFDCVVIALLVNSHHLQDIAKAGFDGFYTYFSADGFTYGSTRQNWHALKVFADEHDLLYIPSVGPGYIDTRIRPWNAENTRKRLSGRYYDESWRVALKETPAIISITSFNEWHEGSQIEEAVQKKTSNFDYMDYKPHSSDYFLKLTLGNVEKFEKCQIPSI